jgi:hypothetical protein
MSEEAEVLIAVMIEHLFPLLLVLPFLFIWVIHARSMF